MLTQHRGRRMRHLFMVGSGWVLATAFFCLEASAQGVSLQSPGRSSAARTGPDNSELARARADVIEKIKETRAGAEKLLALHESERQRRAAEYQKHLELYQQGLIARNDVHKAEHAFLDAMRKVEQDKQWLTETDSVLTEVALRDELLRLPGLRVGGYSETGRLLRFNGASLWQLADVSRVEKFFFDLFGRRLPISALGQTATHDRLRFDHRDAIDVALHPDSREGQSLLDYLRRNGIPFIAFRGALSGSSTGAHIHIGKPSPRL